MAALGAQNGSRAVPQMRLPARNAYPPGLPMTGSTIPVT